MANMIPLASSASLEASHLAMALLVLPCLYGVWLVYAAVPALLGYLAGLRLERVGLGLGWPLVSIRSGGVDVKLGSVPLGAHAKFYGEEGLFGVRPDYWAAHQEAASASAESVNESPQTVSAKRPQNVSHDDSADEADDEDDLFDDDAADHPMPEGSYMTAPPLVRAGVALSGPAALLIAGLVMMAAAHLTSGGGELVLVPRGELPTALRHDEQAGPWVQLPVFGDHMAVPRSLLLAAGGVPDAALTGVASQLAIAAESVVGFFLLVASADGYSGVLAWALMLMRAVEFGAAFWFGLFGLFVCVLGLMALLPLPLPFVQGGMALISLCEWGTARRPTLQIMTPLVWLGFLWLLILLVRLCSADIDHLGV